MAKVLSEADQAEIFNSMKSIFSDFHLFDYLVAERLTQAIKDSNSIELNMKTTKKVVERYFDVESFKTSDQKSVLGQIQIIMKTCYVLILSYHDSSKALMYTMDQFLAVYPDFRDAVSDDELQLLLNFRNMLRLTLVLIPARLNKQIILKIAARLEGSQNEYITGGGQKPAVTHRVKIYELEGGLHAEKRPERPKKQPGQTRGKRGASTSAILSDKKARQIHFESDEIQQLSRLPPNPFPYLDQKSSMPPPMAPSALSSRPVHGFINTNSINPGNDFAKIEFNNQCGTGPTCGESIPLDSIKEIFGYSAAAAVTAPPNHMSALNALSTAASVVAPVPLAQQSVAQIVPPVAPSCGVSNQPQLLLAQGVAPSSSQISSTTKQSAYPAVSMPSFDRTPSLFRESSDPLDRYILSRESEFYKETVQQIREPSILARNVSQSIFDDESFLEDLQAIDYIS